MPGISDSGHPDDIRIHLEEISTADARRAEPEPNETPEEAEVRTSVYLPEALRSRLTATLGDMQASAPGLSAAEANKMLATRHARNALDQAKDALSRVDSHLQSVTGERNPQIGRSYGVYGRNPESFAGVYRSLELCAAEDQRIRALPEAAADRARLFTPVVAKAINGSREQLRELLGASLASRAQLSQKIAVKSDLLTEARNVISAVRNHLYANLPGRKQDPDLREYAFRPVRIGSRGTSEEENVEEAA